MWTHIFVISSAAAITVAIFLLIYRFFATVESFVEYLDKSGRLSATLDTAFRDDADIIPVSGVSFVRTASNTDLTQYKNRDALLAPMGRSE